MLKLPTTLRVFSKQMDPAESLVSAILRQHSKLYVEAPAGAGEAEDQAESTCLKKVLILKYSTIPSSNRTKWLTYRHKWCHHYVAGILHYSSTRMNRKCSCNAACTCGLPNIHRYLQTNLDPVSLLMRTFYLSLSITFSAPGCEFIEKSACNQCDRTSDQLPQLSMWAI